MRERGWCVARVGASLTVCLCASVLTVGPALSQTADSSKQIEEQQRLYEAQKKKFDAKMAAQVPVVYAVRDIPKGAVITAAAVEDRRLDKSQVRADQITNSRLIIGRRTRADICLGQRIGPNDVAMTSQPQDKNLRSLQQRAK